MNAAARPTLDFDALVREHQDRVYRVACRVLHDPAGAEDVAQQVFLKLYQDGGLPSGVANPAAYVARAAVNTALKSVRSEDRRDRREQATRPQAATPDPSLRLVVREAVDDLPSDLKLPIVLHYFEGLGYQEVSDALGVPAGTVAWRISEAKGKLRASLAGIGAALTVAAVDSAIEGADEVSAPPTLAARLRAIPRAPKAAAPPPQIPGAPILGIGAPLAIALLLLFVGGIVVVTSWRPTTRVVHRTVDLPAATTTRALSTTVAETASPAAPQAPATGTPAPTVPAVAAVTEAPEEYDGFLFRDDQGRIGVSTEDVTPGITMKQRPDMLTPASASPFEGLDLGGQRPDAVRSGEGTPEEMPRLYVRLLAVKAGRVEGTLLDFLDVKQVLGVEWVPAGWGQSWQACGKDIRRIYDAIDEVPGETKKAHLRLAAAEAFREIDVLTRLRSTDARPLALRAFPFDDRWRKGEVWVLTESIDGLARQYDALPPGFPETPDPDDLTRIFLEAADQASFRAELTRRYTDEVIAPEAGEWCWYRAEDGSHDSTTLGEMTSTWTPVEFAERQAAARAYAAREEKEPGTALKLQEEEREGFAELGIECEGVSEGECRALGKHGLLRLKAVVQGGAADRVGVRTGDVLWGVEWSDAPQRDGHAQLWSAMDAGRFLHERRSMEVVIVVLRDGALERIRIPAR